MPEVASHDGRLTSDDLAAVAGYVWSHLSQPISVDSLAAVVGVSASCFARLFKQATGKTPHCFVVEKRIEVAKELLTRDRASLGSIAARTGFSDQAHMTRTFRRIVGQTPGDFVAASRTMSR